MCRDYNAISPWLDTNLNVFVMVFGEVHFWQLKWSKVLFGNTSNAINNNIPYASFPCAYGIKKTRDG